MGYVREYQEGDAEALEPMLRDADRAEINASTEKYPLEVLREGAEQSAPSCTVIGNSGAVAAMFGIVPEGEFGRVWLLGADALVERPLVKQFLKECPRFLDVMARPYRAIGNVVLETNVIHVRWLRFMGFTFTRVLPNYGINGETFLEFNRETKAGFERPMPNMAPFAPRSCQTSQSFASSKKVWTND